jgi:hypothetical protein
MGQALEVARKSNEDALASNKRYNACFTLPKLDAYHLGELLYMLAMSVAYEGELANVDAFGKVSSGSFHRYVTMEGVKQNRWFLNREAELYYFYFSKDSNKRLIIFEPVPEMVDYIKAYLPYGAYQEN